VTAVTYTAQRSLTAGHSQGTVYQLRLPLISLERGPVTRRSAASSLSMKTETLLWARKRRWQATTAVLFPGPLDAVREFLDSVIGGELFTFDEYGQPGQPGLEVSVILDGDYGEQRIIREGDGGQNDGFRFSFAMREA